MSARRIAVMTAVGLLTLPALAGAASQLTATNVRIGDHPAFVRVVVDFNGKIRSNDVEAGRFAPRMSTVRLARSGVTTQVSTRTGDAVRVALQPGTQMLHIAMTFARQRFKYLSYAVVTGNRLAIDLWKSAASARPIQTCPGFSIQTWGVTPGIVAVSGHGRGIFENTFAVALRGANGTVLARRADVHARPTWPGNWGARMHYKTSRRQRGTLEAVAFSAKDGSVECLAQTPVTLPAS